MKKTIPFVLFTFFAICAHAQVGIGTTTPSASSQLEVQSESKGVLLPRLTAVQITTLASNLTSTNLASDSGMVVFNISENCLQIWNGTVFQCLSVVSGGSLGNAGAVKVNVTGALAAAIAETTSHPAYMRWTSQGSGDFKIFGNATSTGGVAYNITPSELNLSSAPTTNWPENETNQTLTGGIYTNNNVFESTPVETADAWRENNISGQVHLWRISVLGNPGNASGGEFECRLRNPETGFVTGYAQLVPAVSGLYSQTFTLTTIADDGSLTSGTGDGYVLEFRANSGALEIWVDSITRISLFNE